MGLVAETTATITNLSIEELVINRSSKCIASIIKEGMVQVR
jgi:hypothetical protein